MGQGIQDFYWQISNRNLARTHQFRLAQIGGTIFGDDDLVLVRSASIPEKTVNTVNAPFMGLKFNVPTGITYGGSESWPVSFYCTQDFSIYKELQKLTLDIMDEQRGAPIGRGGAGNMAVPGYENMIQLDLINDRLQIIDSYYLIGTFIKKLNSIEYNLGGDDGKIVEIKAEFAYQFWTRNPSGRNSNIFDKIYSTVGKINQLTNNIGNIARGFGGGG